MRRWGFSARRIHTPKVVSWVFEYPDFNEADGFATCNRVTTSDSKKAIDLHRTHLNSTYSLPVLADGRHSTTQCYSQLYARPSRGQYSQTTSQIVEGREVTRVTSDSATAHWIGHQSDPRRRSASAESIYIGGPSNQVRNPTTRGRITMPSPTNDDLSLRDLVASHAACRQRRQVVFELLSSFSSQGQNCTEDNKTHLLFQALLTGRQSLFNNSLQHWNSKLSWTWIDAAIARCESGGQPQPINSITYSPHHELYYSCFLNL